VWYSALVVVRMSSNPSFSSVNSDAVNEPRSVGKVLAFPVDSLLSHTFPLTTNDLRRVNNLKNAQNLCSSNKHIHSFNSWTVPARDPKHASSDASSKPMNEIAARVTDSR